MQCMQQTMVIALEWLNLETISIPPRIIICKIFLFFFTDLINRKQKIIMHI